MSRQHGVFVALNAFNCVSKAAKVTKLGITQEGKVIQTILNILTVW